VKFQAGAKYLACAKDFTILTMAAGTSSQYSTGGESAHKSWALGNHSSLGDYMDAVIINKEEIELISWTREKSAVADSAEPKQ
jgi:hypothetical protein